MDPELQAKGDQVIDLVRSGRDIVVVTGPAGTGKTQLISYIVERLSGERRPAVVAYTGQAARMLSQRGIEANTCHSTIYVPAEAKRAELQQVVDRMAELVAEGKENTPEYVELRSRRNQLTRPGFLLKSAEDLEDTSVIIIDEVSMIGEQLGGDIESFGIPILAVGDPYQLPPVPDGQGNSKRAFDLDNPDVHLDRIFRQAEGSEIIKVATAVREGKGLWPPPHRGTSVKIRAFSDMNNDDIRSWMVSADQVICWTNDTRRRLNGRMLKYLGHALGMPDGSEGEKIICLKNNPAVDLTNGQPFRVSNVSDEGNANFVLADVSAQDGKGKWTSRGRWPIYRGRFVAPINRRHKDVDEQARADLLLHNGPPGIIDCDWGFAITVHKAQGSEWPRVLYVHEGGEPELNYTAVTRASQRLDVIHNWGVR